MRLMRISNVWLGLGVGLWLLLAGNARAQKRLEPVPVPDKVLADETVVSDTSEWSSASENAIGKLLELAVLDKRRALGFERVPRRSELTILQPLAEAVVQVSDLKLYAVGQPVAPLIRVANRLMFPLLLGNRVHSSVVLIKVKGVWRPGVYGEVTLARAVMLARTVASSALGSNSQPLLKPGQDANFTIVEIAGLNLRFLSATGLQGLYLIPLFDNARLGFKLGAPLRAQEVLLRLVPDAKTHNGLPT